MLKFSRSNPCYSYHLFILKKPKLDSTERYLGLRNSYQSFELTNEVTKKREDPGVEWDGMMGCEVG